MARSNLAMASSSGPWRGILFHTYGGISARALHHPLARQDSGGAVSNEMVHQIDTFTTFAKITGTRIPDDRAIDGVDQTDFFFGPPTKLQSRKCFGVCRGTSGGREMAKLGNSPFTRKPRTGFSTPMKLTLPKLFNLTTDPKEEYPEETLRNTWVMVSCLKAIRRVLRLS